MRVFSYGFETQPSFPVRLAVDFWQVPSFISVGYYVPTVSAVDVRVPALPWKKSIVGNSTSHLRRQANRTKWKVNAQSHREFLCQLRGAEALSHKHDDFWAARPPEACCTTQEPNQNVIERSDVPIAAGGTVLKLSHKFRPGHSLLPGRDPADTWEEVQLRAFEKPFAR